MRCGRCVVCVFCCGGRVWSVGAEWRVESRAFGVLGRGGVGFVEWEGDGPVWIREGERGVSSEIKGVRRLAIEISYADRKIRVGSRKSSYAERARK